MTGVNVLPAIHVEKAASLTQVQAGAQTSVTFTYDVTNISTTSLDPLTLTHLVDDIGTVATGDDVDLLAHGTFVGGDTNGNSLIDKGETWSFHLRRGRDAERRGNADQYRDRHGRRR